MKCFYILLIVILSLTLLLSATGCSPVHQEVMPSEEASEETVESIGPTALEYNDAVFFDYENGVLRLYGDGPLLGGSSGSALGYRYTSARNAISIVVLGEVTHIGPYAFAGFDHLQKCVIDAPVSSMGMAIFASNHSLKVVDMRKTILETLTMETFTYCQNLQEVLLPSTITSIDSFAFEGCTSLDTITFEGTVNQWNTIDFGNNVFDGCHEIRVNCTNGTLIIKSGEASQ